MVNPRFSYRYLDTRLASGVWGLISPVVSDPTSLIQQTEKFLMYCSETGRGGATERQSGTAELWREHSMAFFFFFFSQKEGGGTRRKDRWGKTEVLPEFIVAGCGRNGTRGLQRKRDKGRSLTRRGGGRKASSNLIRDWFRLSSSTLQKFFVVFFFRWAASELFGTPGGRLLQGHTGPKRGEILSAAHVRSLEQTHENNVTATSCSYIWSTVTELNFLNKFLQI